MSYSTAAIPRRGIPTANSSGYFQELYPEGGSRQQFRKLLTQACSKLGNQRQPTATSRPKDQRPLKTTNPTDTSRPQPHPEAYKYTHYKLSVSECPGGQDGGKSWVVTRNHVARAKCAGSDSRSSVGQSDGGGSKVGRFSGDSVPMRQQQSAARADWRCRTDHCPLPKLQLDRSADCERPKQTTDFGETPGLCESVPMTDDTLSSQQNDSAYDSTDQDDWKDGWNEKRRRANSNCYQLWKSNGELRMDRKQNGKIDIDAGDCTMTSCSTESMDATDEATLRAKATPSPALTIECYTVRINRRCSEPILGINSSQKMINQQELLARSHDDCSISTDGLHFDSQQMEKQVSEEHFTKYQFSNRIADNLNASSHSELSTASSSKASSISSLASSYSNLSENSVFIISPLISPTCCSEENSSFSECPEKLQTNSIQDPDNNAKPMKEKVKKLLKKTQSWGPIRTFNTNQESSKENSWKEKVPTCETVHEDQGNQSNAVRYRARTISIDEVFQRVDSKRLCSPPPYHKAVEENNPLPPDATRKGMTVKNMRRLSQLEEVKKLYCPVIAGKKTRPYSLTEDLLYPSWQNHCTNHSDSCAKQAQPKPTNQCEDSRNNFENNMHPTGFEKAKQYRGRAMSECLRRSKHELLCKHFSQNLEDYEQIQHAKESYV
ncbi:T cell activation RhoGTPase activating protein b [Rhincodon typus]|uniref:T cell activation RhoGTPase activating protein b n=1 Tax=Rhincodon typus TaxID=259920 RepID=UPI00202EEF94|nr:T cell activation RhoGTPase activating protein b [Rhincodon typus]